MGHEGILISHPDFSAGGLTQSADGDNTPGVFRQLQENCVLLPGQRENPFATADLRPVQIHGGGGKNDRPIAVGICPFQNRVDPQKKFFREKGA